MSIQHRRCPECGDRDHLYGNTDSKWSHDRQEWVSFRMDDIVECTECDWSGSVEDTLMVVEDEPCLIVRHLRGPCPDGCKHGEA